METAMISATSVKKELYKSKAMAKFSHYVGGSIYYTVELESGTYKFPMSTTEDKSFYYPSEDDGDEMEFEYIELSADLGTTEFFAEMKGSELNRWIQKAIESGEFMKID
jgi:hypothetical protein